MAEEKKDSPVSAAKAPANKSEDQMVLLRRPFYIRGRLYDTNPAGTAIPAGIHLPKDAKIRKGDEWVSQVDAATPKAEDPKK